eukprot:215865_1
MNEKRGFFACKIVNNKLYAIGGSIEPKNYLKNTIEMLMINNQNNIQQKQWNYIDPLPVYIAQHRAIQYHDNIIILGGLYGDTQRAIGWNKKLFVINTLTDTITSNGSINYAYTSM